MIERLHVRGFKALRDVTVDLMPLTVIVGPNASGKTSILEAITCLGQLGEKGWEQCVSDPAHVLSRFEGAEVRECSIEAQITRYDGDRESRLRLQLTATGGRPKGHVELSASVGVFADADSVLANKQMRQNLRTGGFLARMLRLSEKTLAAPSSSARLTTAVADDGENLAAALADLKLAHEGAFTALEARATSVVPQLRRIRFDKVPIEREEYSYDERTGMYDKVRVRDVGYGLEFVFANSEAIPAALVSEGTLLALGLLAIAFGRDRPDVLLIEEIDRGLHPRALGSLIAQLRELQGPHPDTAPQIIASTHSPYVLDHVRPEEVVVTTLGDDGGVIAGKLTEHPEFEKWKDEMSPGEFWAAVGEDWLKDRKAKQP